MKDIASTLRRIDQEIDTQRKEILVRQALITQLEDSRKLFMGMVEADLTATQAPRQQQLAAGSMAKPVLIMRPMTEEPDAPKGIVASGKRKGLPRLRAPRGGTKVDRKALPAMRKRILEFIQPGDEPIASSELANNMGLPMGEVARKGMHNALFNMRTKGLLLRDDAGRYYRPAPNGAGQ